MAPKKKQQQQQKQKQKQYNNNSKPNSKSQNSSSSSSSSGPRLQISAENENRLRRLLLNNNNSARSDSAPVDDTLSKAQKAKKLKTVYEKLSCEGFTNDQIELALSALKEGATFEAGLDWLCLNLPGNELPLKFASENYLRMNEGGSVGVILNSREDWAPSVEPLTKIEEEAPEFSVKIKGRRDDDTLDLRQPSQADWIRQYMEQQQEPSNIETKKSQVVENTLLPPRDEAGIQVVALEVPSDNAIPIAVGGGEGSHRGINADAKFEEKIQEQNKFRLKNLNSKDVDSGRERHIRRSSWLRKGLTVEINEFGKRRVSWQRYRSDKQAVKWVTREDNSAQVVNKGMDNGPWLGNDKRRLGPLLSSPFVFEAGACSKQPLNKPSPDITGLTVEDGAGGDESGVFRGSGRKNG
nr:dexh-box atp-dependent rna helicase dexh7, chloroplastic [Quercus suber]